jgi:hypothetical protein
MSIQSTNVLKALFSRGSALLPHEYLMMLSRGIQVSPVFDDTGHPMMDSHGVMVLSVSRFDDPNARAQAAVAAAPYYAPRLSAQAVALRDPGRQTPGELQASILSALGMSADDLAG